jgi:hypothetical protein
MPFILKQIVYIAEIWEAEIKRIVVQGQPGQKVNEIPSQQNKPGMVYNLS